MRSKLRTIAVSVIALLLVVVFSASALGDGTYYWTRTGKRYHTHRDCPSLANSRTVYSGSYSQASGRGRTLCQNCEYRDRGSSPAGNGGYGDGSGEEQYYYEEPVQTIYPEYGPDGTQAMYRLYNPNSGEHFYTANINETNNLVGLGWNYEGVGWFAPDYSDTPVFRLYNPYAGDHHYTTSSVERDALAAIGWQDEGVGWYSDDLQRQPLYRQYNPNQYACNHNYTTSKGENDTLVSYGWQAEGIAWYGVE